MQDHRQPNLFGPAQPPPPPHDPAALQRMRDTIARLAATDTPAWTDELGSALEDGAFKRAMRLVSPEDAAALWERYDAEMERLYAAWTASRAG